MSSVQTWLRRTIGTIIQLDEPVAPRSQEDIEDERERNYAWNFGVNLADGAAFFFGSSFISSSTIAPLFVSKLTTSPLAVGLIAVIAQGGWYLPQLFTANVVERLPRTKPLVVKVGFVLDRLPMWLPVLAALIAVIYPSLALAIFFLGYAWHSLGAGVIATGWQELIARCFPVERRGRFFGITSFLGTGMGALGALVSTWILKQYPFATNFVYIFGIAALSITVSWIALALTREPEQPVTAPRQSNHQFLTNLPQIIKKDHNYRRFLIARAFLAFGNLGTGFVTVAALQRWHVPDSTVGVFTITFLAGQTVGNLLFGLLADRFGHKLSLEVGALASVLAFAVAWLAPAPAWYYLVFFFLGINVGATIVSGILVVFEFSEPRRRPTYVGLSNTMVGMVGIVAPLVGASIASASYSWLFAISLVINLVALIALRWWVREPRWTTVTQL